MELVAQRLETVLPANLIAQFPQLIAAKLDHLARLDTDQVIISLLPCYNFIIGLLIVKKNLLANSGILKVIECPINGGPADAVAQLFNIVN